jgi:hypothetical protein
MPTKKTKPIPPKNSLLTVLWEVSGELDNNDRRPETWLCQCKCGQTKKVLSKRIRNGATRSCGCLRVAMGHQKAAKARAAYSEQCKAKRERING